MKRVKNLLLLPIAVGFVFIMTGISQAAPYAVLINGGYDTYNNNIAFYNDLSTIYGTLITDYGYLEDNVYVLNSDGLNSANDRNTVTNFHPPPWIYSYDSSPFDLDGNGSNDVDYAATKGDIQTVFSTLATQMTSQDSLFVWTTDHGGSQGGTDTGLWLWESSYITDAAFAVEVNKITNYAYEIFSFQQCYGGGFIDNLTGSNRVLMSAASAYESAWFYVNEYCEYNYEFNNAVSGLGGDVNGDGYVSMLEAYNYVLLNDDFANGTYASPYIEHPQYWDGSGIGDMVTLNGTLDTFDPIPEPGTMILIGSLAAGLFGAAAVRKRQ